MTPLFNRIDYASDAVFLLWFAVGMAAIGLVIGAYMAGRRAWRWTGRARRRRRIGRRADRLVEFLKDADMRRG